MTRKFKNICVYCGSSSGTQEAYQAVAQKTGEILATQGIGLVYGGGRVGLMGALADGALAAGGTVTGVIPKALMAKELGHAGIQTLHVVRDMHERKHLMASIADAFIALPGGWGTLEELTEMLTWLQLGFHAKPIGLINVCGYYDSFLDFAARMMHEGFVRAEHRALFSVDTEPAALIEQLSARDLPQRSSADILPISAANEPVIDIQ